MEISSFYVVVKHVITCYSSFGFGAIVAQERRKVGCRDYGTRNGHSKRAKRSRHEQNSTKKGCYV